MDRFKIVIVIIIALLLCFIVFKELQKTSSLKVDDEVILKNNIHKGTKCRVADDCLGGFFLSCDYDPASGCYSTYYFDKVEIRGKVK